MVRRKHRALELKTGAARAKPAPNPNPVRNNQSIEDKERAVAQQAEAAYQRLADRLGRLRAKEWCGRDKGARIIEAL